MQRLLCWLFAKIYKKWLYDDFYGTYNKVLKVHGWRLASVAVIDKNGNWVDRKTIETCFWVFK